MKTLSDYKGEEAIELWADLLDPFSEIFSDKEVISAISNKSRMAQARVILKTHAKAAEAILLRIDPEPIDGLTIIFRLLSLLAEIGRNKDIKSFFSYAAQAKTGSESSGSVMENTEVAEN